jgi:predicted ester cyclase
MAQSRRLPGAAPRAKRITLTGITIERFEHGKIVEAWHNTDTLGLLRQIETEQQATWKDGCHQWPVA